MKTLLRLPFLLAVLALGACAGLPPAPVVEQEHDQRLAELRALSSWSLKARAAVRTADEAGTVSMDWRQIGERYTLNMRAPWGAGSVRVEGGPGAVWLRTGDGEEAYAEDAEELLSLYTGYDLPLESLRYWLLGIAAPDAEAGYEFDEQGLPRRLHQQGWRIEYSRYQVVDGLVLPGRVDLHGEDVEVRVGVREWQWQR